MLSTPEGTLGRSGAQLDGMPVCGMTAPWDESSAHSTSLAHCAERGGAHAQGRELSRRERKQLVRTTNDLMRMVPFALFIVIPFMEFMLPLALKLFPNMLPSTFQDKLKKEEEMRQRVQVRHACPVSPSSHRMGRDLEKVEPRAIFDVTPSLNRGFKSSHPMRGR